MFLCLKTCSYVFKNKKHVLMSLCLKTKNMFLCSYVLKQKTCPYVFKTKTWPYVNEAK